MHYEALVPEVVHGRRWDGQSANEDTLTTMAGLPAPMPRISGKLAPWTVLGESPYKGGQGVGGGSRAHTLG